MCREVGYHHPPSDVDTESVDGMALPAHTWAADRHFSLSPAAQRLHIPVSARVPLVHLKLIATG